MSVKILQRASSYKCILTSAMYFEVFNMHVSPLKILNTCEWKLRIYNKSYANLIWFNQSSIVPSLHQAQNEINFFL